MGWGVKKDPLECSIIVVHVSICLNKIVWVAKTRRCESWSGWLKDHNQIERPRSSRCLPRNSPWLTRERVNDWTMTLHLLFNCSLLCRELSEWWWWWNITTMLIFLYRTLELPSNFSAYPRNVFCERKSCKHNVLILGLLLIAYPWLIPPTTRVLLTFLQISKAIRAMLCK